MKIIVSHSQKQHAYRLVVALQIKNRLKVFFTALYFKQRSLIFMLSQKYTKLKRIISKRNFDEINDSLVYQTIFPIIVEVITKKIYFTQPYLGNYFRDRSHDWIVSGIQYFYNYDIVVGYERQCYKTFKNAKKRRKVRVLDLASIHPSSQQDINNNYNHIIGDEEIGFLEKERFIKEKEYKLADYVLVLSKFAKNTCISAGLSEEKLFTVHLGVDIENFNAKIEYNQEDFEVLFVSAVRYLKGIKELIEAFKLLNLPNAKLTIVGGVGDAIDFVQDNISDNIVYIPYLTHDKLKNIYRRASIFVLPSYMDSWGQVVPEAMACGTPVIVSENTGSKDIVNHGDSGFIIKTGNQIQLSEKILYFYEHRDEIERMGKNARKCVEHLTWKNYYRQINVIMEKIGNKIK